MNPLLFWNELAERPLAPNRFAAKARMDSLVDTLAALRRAFIGPTPRLRTQTPLHGVELAEAYTVANWLTDATQVRRLLFRQMEASSPILRAADDEGALVDRFGCADCWHGTQRALGLRAACVADEIAVSLRSADDWGGSAVEVELERLGGGGELERVAARVRHVSGIEHVAPHQPWLVDRARTSVVDGRDLFRRRRELFPALDWCDGLEKRLTAFDAGTPHLRQIVNRLLELQTAFAGWDRKPIHPGFVPCKCTPETPDTLREEATDHQATGPDGVTRVFSWHVRFTPDAGRIFFDGDPLTGRGLVGYIGLKKGGRLT